jgi:hypothetical protein
MLEYFIIKSGKLHIKSIETDETVNCNFARCRFLILYLQYNITSWLYYKVLHNPEGSGEKFIIR